MSVYMTPGRTRWICPVCDQPAGRINGNGLSRHGTPPCPGAGTPVAELVEWTPPDAVPKPAPVPVLLPPPWIPPVLPVDRAPFRRWRALGWTETQIAAVTGDGALW